MKDKAFLARHSLIAMRQPAEVAWLIRGTVRGNRFPKSDRLSAHISDAALNGWNKRTERFRHNELICEWLEQEQHIAENT